MCVWRHSIHNPENIVEWDRLMFALLDMERDEAQLRRLNLWNNVSTKLSKAKQSQYDQLLGHLRALVS